jgi:hypothetical protein
LLVEALSKKASSRKKRLAHHYTHSHLPEVTSAGIGTENRKTAISVGGSLSSRKVAGVSKGRSLHPSG